MSRSRISKGLEGLGKALYPGAGVELDPEKLQDKCREIARDIAVNAQRRHSETTMLDSKTLELANLLVELEQVDPYGVEQVLLMLPERERQHLAPVHEQSEM